MYDNETEILSSCHLSLSTYFRIVINPVFLYTKKKITKLGSLRYRLKKNETKSNKNVHLEAIVKMSGNLAESQFLPSGETQE